MNHYVGNTNESDKTETSIKYGLDCFWFQVESTVKVTPQLAVKAKCSITVNIGPDNNR
jgi:hypothetical protein